METTTIHECEDLRILRTEAPARCVCAECGQVYELRDGLMWKVISLPAASYTSSIKPFNTKRRRHRTKSKKKGSKK